MSTIYYQKICIWLQNSVWTRWNLLAGPLWSHAWYLMELTFRSHYHLSRTRNQKLLRFEKAIYSFFLFSQSIEAVPFSFWNQRSRRAATRLGNTTKQQELKGSSNNITEATKIEAVPWITNENTGFTSPNFAFDFMIDMVEGKAAESRKAICRKQDNELVHCKRHDFLWYRNWVN